MKCAYYGNNWRLLKNSRRGWDEVDDGDIIETIHVLGMSLFCKKHTHIEKDDFVWSIYRFLVMASIKERDDVMEETDIAGIIAKIQWTGRAMIYEEMLRRMEKMTEETAESIHQRGRLHRIQFYTTEHASGICNRI